MVFGSIGRFEGCESDEFDWYKQGGSGLWLSIYVAVWRERVGLGARTIFNWSERGYVERKEGWCKDDHREALRPLGLIRSRPFGRSSRRVWGSTRRGWRRWDSPAIRTLVQASLALGGKWPAAANAIARTFLGRRDLEGRPPGFEPGRARQVVPVRERPPAVGMAGSSDGAPILGPKNRSSSGGWPLDPRCIVARDRRAPPIGAPD